MSAARPGSSSGRPRGRLLLLLPLGACVAPLVPGEQIIGAEWPAEERVGPPASELGTVVDWADGVWVATSPGTGNLALGDGTLPVAASFVGFWGAHLVYVDAAGVAFVDGEARWTVEGAVAWAAGPGGVFAATADELLLLGPGRRVPVAGVRDLAVGEDRVLALCCDEGGCAGRAWSLFGLDTGLSLPAGEGGAVGEWAGVAWAGDPMLDDPDAPGLVRAEDGRAIEGEPGDHLGMAVGGGYTVGTFNKWIVPARARVVPLDDGPVFAFDVGAEDQPYSLAGDGETLVIGAPFHPSHGLPSGALFGLGGW